MASRNSPIAFGKVFPASRMASAISSGTCCWNSSAAFSRIVARSEGAVFCHLSVADIARVSARSTSSVFVSTTAPGRSLWSAGLRMLVTVVDDE